MPIEIHDKEIRPLLQIILADSKPEPHLRYRLRQRIEARLYEMDPSYTGPLGPTWTVWLSEPGLCAAIGGIKAWTDWNVDTEFSFPEDPDGAKAKAAAHAHARRQRSVYRCSLFAVTPATREPLQYLWKHVEDPAQDCPSTPVFNP